ncbi:MAG TPA: efflux transporter outer membrane subunit, partial [Caulobacteraceae bacterium]|nr:efflux transporter outer membrane subunit [Caulobacteraceae bacterium]
PGDWWRLFDDPVLDGLVAEALSANKDLEIAAANLARVRASLGEARAGRLPSTTTTAGASYGRQAATVTPGATEPLEESESYSAGLDVSYEVDIFGRVRNTIAAARADVGAAEAALNATRVVIAAETARAYADACAANTRIAVAERSVGLQERTVQLTERLLRAGSGTGLDVARASSALHSVEASLPPLRAVREEAVFRLATLTGRTPQQASEEARACAAIPQVRTAIPVGEGAALLARRPDVRQAERQLAAAAARVGVATASLYPQVVLGGSLGVTALDIGDLASSEAVRFNVGPLISWSFPNVAVARARVAAARAGADVSLAQFDRTVLVALQEVETALSAYANELDRRTALQAARDQSAEAARLARLRFDAGMDSFLTVLDAERTLANDEALLAQSQAQVTTNQVQLFKALGGGWQGEGA